MKSTHWCHTFIVHVWIEEDKTENIVLISDELNHTKHSIYVNMKCIIMLLKQKFLLFEVCDYIPHCLTEYPETCRSSLGI